MGEAREKSLRLGNERQIHITRRELVELLNLMVTPGGGDGRPRFTEKRDDRDRLFDVLRQLGSDSDIVIDAWERAQSAKDNKENARIIDQLLPEISFPKITVDAINYMRNNLFTSMTMHQALALGRLEKRVIDALDGRYEIPAEHAAAFKKWEAEQQPSPEAS